MFRPVTGGIQAQAVLARQQLHWNSDLTHSCPLDCRRWLHRQGHEVYQAGGRAVHGTAEVKAFPEAPELTCRSHWQRWAHGPASHREGHVSAAPWCGGQSWSSVGRKGAWSWGWHLCTSGTLHSVTSSLPNKFNISQGTMAENVPRGANYLSPHPHPQLMSVAQPWCRTPCPLWQQRQARLGGRRFEAAGPCFLLMGGWGPCQVTGEMADGGRGGCQSGK